MVRLDGTGLAVAEQAIGLTALPASPPAYPLDGLIGFAGPLSDVLNSSTWFLNLCAQRTVDECRFGLALDTDGTGKQYLGKVEHERFNEPLSVTSLYYLSQYQTYFQWTTFGDLAVNGEVVVKDASIIFDSGTTVIFG